MIGNTLNLNFLFYTIKYNSYKVFCIETCVLYAFIAQGHKISHWHAKNISLIIKPRCLYIVAK